MKRLLDDVIDATFLKRGFRAHEHREAILAALDRAGYAIVPKPPGVDINQLFEEAENEEMRADNKRLRKLLREVIDVAKCVGASGEVIDRAEDYLRTQKWQKI